MRYLFISYEWYIQFIILNNLQRMSKYLWNMISTTLFADNASIYSIIFSCAKFRRLKRRHESQEEKKSEKIPIFFCRTWESSWTRDGEDAHDHSPVNYFLPLLRLRVLRVPVLLRGGTTRRWHRHCSRSRAYQNILDDPPFDSPFIAGETA